MEEKFTVGEFSAVNIKFFGRLNVRKLRENKGTYKYVTLDILFKFGIIENMRITSSYPKDSLGISGKELIASLGFKAKSRPKK